MICIMLLEFTSIHLLNSVSDVVSRFIPGQEALQYTTGCSSALEKESSQSVK